VLCGVEAGAMELCAISNAQLRPSPVSAMDAADKKQAAPSVS
jgi:hypothetical protein